MLDTTFDVPVVVEPKWGRQRVVSSAREAGELLLREWPTRECLKRRKAMLACLSVIRGDSQPSVARKAFLEAAKVARIMPSKPPTQSLKKAKAASARAAKKTTRSRILQND